MVEDNAIPICHSRESGNPVYINALITLLDSLVKPGNDIFKLHVKILTLCKRYLKPAENK